MLGLVFTISYISIPCSTTMTSSSIYAVRNAPGMSNTATPLILYASISDVTSKNYNDTVGYVASFFWDPSWYFWPSVHDCPLTVLLNLSLRKIIDPSAYYFSFSLIFTTFMGEKVILMCSLFSYFPTAASPNFLNLLGTFIRKYCAIT